MSRVAVKTKTFAELKVFTNVKYHDIHSHLIHCFYTNINYSSSRDAVFGQCQWSNKGYRPRQTGKKTERLQRQIVKWQLTVDGPPYCPWLTKLKAFCYQDPLMQHTLVCQPCPISFAWQNSITTHHSWQGASLWLAYILLLPRMHTHTHTHTHSQAHRQEKRLGRMKADQTQIQ